MSPLCQGRICHTRRCTLSHDRPQDISSTALDNFFLILSLLFFTSPLSSPIFCFYLYTSLIYVAKIKGLSDCVSAYLAVNQWVHLLSIYPFISIFFFILTSASFIFCSTFLVVWYHPPASLCYYVPILSAVSIFLSLSLCYPSSLLFCFVRGLLFRWNLL